MIVLSKQYCTLFLLLMSTLALFPMSVLASPSGSISASPSPCPLAVGANSCQITLTYSATDVPEGWVVLLKSNGINFLQAIAASDTTVSGSVTTQASLPGETFAVVKNRGLEADDVLASVFVSVEQEEIEEPEQPADPSGAFSTTKNPCELSTGHSTCNVTLGFTVENTDSPSIWRSDDGGVAWTLFFQGIAIGVSAEGITKQGSLFELRAGADRTTALLATATLFAEEPREPASFGTLSASPLTCIVPAKLNYCTTTLAATADNVGSAQIQTLQDGNWVLKQGNHFKAEDRKVRIARQVGLNLPGANFRLVGIRTDGTRPILASVYVSAEREIVPNDSDGDSVPDDADAFPNDPSEWDDVDGDGIGDNVDTRIGIPTATISVSASECTIPEGQRFCEVDVQFTAKHIPEVYLAVRSHPDSGWGRPGDRVTIVKTNGTTTGSLLYRFIHNGTTEFGVREGVNGEYANNIWASVQVVGRLASDLSNPSDNPPPPPAPTEPPPEEEPPASENPDEVENPIPPTTDDPVDAQDDIEEQPNEEQPDTPDAGDQDGDNEGNQSDQPNSDDDRDSVERSISTKVAGMTGAPEIQRAGSTASNTIAANDELRAGDVLTTRDSASIELEFTEKNVDSSVVLKEASVLKIEPTDETSEGTIWAELQSGTVQINFERTGESEDATRRCPIRTPIAGACARGTSYTLAYFHNGEIGTTELIVTTGTVELLSATGELIAIVDAGESYSYQAIDSGEFLDISSQYSATAYLLTSSTSQNTTFLHIINSMAGAQTLSGTLFDKQGVQLGNKNQPLFAESIKAGQRAIFTSADLESVFGVPAWSGPAMLEVKGPMPFDLMTKLVNPSGLVSNTNCVREDTVMNIEGTETQAKTFVRFINTTDAVINDIRGTLYDVTGSAIGTSDSLLIESIAPKAQVWINRNQFESLIGTEWIKEATLTVKPQNGLKLLNLNFVNNSTFFNFSCFESKPQQSESGFAFLQTTTTSANVSVTHLVNTSTSELAFTGSLYSREGELLGQERVELHEGTIAPLGRLLLSSEKIEQIFNASPWSGPAILEVFAEADFEVMTKLTSPSGLVSNTNCVREKQVHNIEGFDSQDLSYIRFINIGNQTITDIRGRLLSANGDQLGLGEVTLISELPPKSARWLNRDNLAALFEDTWQAEATLDVSNTEDSLKLLNLNFTNGETFTNFSCYENAF